MRFYEIIKESNSIGEVTLSDFTITPVDDGKFQIKASATSGPQVQAIRSFAFFTIGHKFLDSGEDQRGESEEIEPYNQYKLTSYAYKDKIETFTLSGKSISKGRPSLSSFKASGVLATGELEDIKSLLAAAVKYTNDDLAERQRAKELAPERRKEKAQAYAKKRKVEVDKRNAKYGKDVVDRVKIKQVGGDDGYSWAVIVDGRVKWNGLTQRQAQSYQEKEWKRLSVGEVKESSNLPIGKVVPLPEMLWYISDTLAKEHPGIAWKMTMRVDSVFLFSAPNDYGTWSMVMVSSKGDGWVTVESGLVDPDGEVGMDGNKFELPITVASASEIANFAIQSYHDADLSEFGEDD